MTPRTVIGDMWWTMTFFVGVFGLCVGSFINVLVWRLPRCESLINPGSHCPRCGHVLRPWENVPIFSWLFLRGHCSNCSQPISVRYPLVEFWTGVIFLLLWWRVWEQHLPLSVLVPYLFLGAAAIAVALIDVEHLIIPNDITFSGLGLALIIAVLFPETHLYDMGGAGLSGGQERFLLGWLLNGPLPGGAALLRSPRLMALLDTALGAVVGFGMLWAVGEAGKRLWGKRVLTVDEPCEATVSVNRLAIAEHMDVPLDDVLVRHSDRFEAVASALQYQPSARQAPTPGMRDVGPATLVVTSEWVEINGERQPRSGIERIEAALTHWSVPREVLGFGDVKLLAMIGALLGPDPCVFILMISAIIGTILGTLIVLLHPQKQDALIPFGPFLALGAVLWMLRGSEMVAWYGRFIMRLM